MCWSVFTGFPVAGRAKRNRSVFLWLRGQGTYYPYGGTIASIINKYVPGLEASAEVTGASVENSRLIEQNEAQLALVMDDVVYHALHAEGAFDHVIELRTLFEMYPHFFHIAVHDGSPIKTLDDLAGKKVSVGAPGSERRP